MPQFVHQSAELAPRRSHCGAKSQDDETIPPIIRAIFHPIRPMARESLEVRNHPHRTHGFPRAVQVAHPNTMLDMYLHHLPAGAPASP